MRSVQSWSALSLTRWTRLSNTSPMSRTPWWKKDPFWTLGWWRTDPWWKLFWFVFGVAVMLAVRYW